MSDNGCAGSGGEWRVILDETLYSYQGNEGDPYLYNYRANTDGADEVLLTIEAGTVHLWGWHPNKPQPASVRVGPDICLYCQFGAHESCTEIDCVCPCHQKPTSEPTLKEVQARDKRIAELEELMHEAGGKEQATLATVAGRLEGLETAVFMLSEANKHREKLGDEDWARINAVLAACAEARSEKEVPHAEA